MSSAVSLIVAGSGFTYSRVSCVLLVLIAPGMIELGRAWIWGRMFVCEDWEMSGGEGDEAEGRFVVSPP